MLANVLKSGIATQMSIRLVKAFVQLRKTLSTSTKMQLEIAEIKYTVEQIAKKQKGHDQNIELIFEYIDRLQDKAESPSYKQVTVVTGFAGKSNEDLSDASHGD